MSIHVEAPDEMGHQGSVERKVKAIEYLDQRLIRIVAGEMDRSGEDYRLLIMPDHRRQSAAVPMSPIRFHICSMTAERMRDRGCCTVRQTERNPEY